MIAASIAAYRALARRRLPLLFFEYLAMLLRLRKHRSAMSLSYKHLGWIE